MKYIIRLFFGSLLAFVLARNLPGVHVTSYMAAILFAFVLSLLNFFVRPVLVFLTLPVTVFTLGLFLIIINAVMVRMASGFIDGFKIDGFRYALLFSVLYSFISYLLFPGSGKKSD